MNLKDVTSECLIFCLNQCFDSMLFCCVSDLFQIVKCRVQYNYIPFERILIQVINSGKQNHVIPVTGVVIFVDDDGDIRRRRRRDINQTSITFVAPVATQNDEAPLGIPCYILTH